MGSSGALSPLGLLQGGLEREAGVAYGGWLPVASGTQQRGDDGAGPLLAFGVFAQFAGQGEQAAVAQLVAMRLEDRLGGEAGEFVEQTAGGHGVTGGSEKRLGFAQQGEELVGPVALRVEAGQVRAQGTASPSCVETLRMLQPAAK